MTANTDSQEPAGRRRTQPAGPPAPFRLAPTFKIDLVFSVVYVALFIHLWRRGAPTTAVCWIAGSLGVALALCYVGKVYIIEALNRRGGDARHYVISDGLVTTGLYAFSRNPTYLLTLIQCVLWSAMLVVLQLSTTFELIPLFAALAGPVLFFVVMDRVVEREDAALSAAHPEAFEAYSKQVRRWFGRKGNAGVKSVA